MNASKTVLVFLSHYTPGFKTGGPLQSVANLVQHLGEEFRFRIITSDRDYEDTDPYPNIEPSTWLPVGRAKVLYLPPEKLNLLSIARVMRETPHDRLYLNSFWNPKFTSLPLLARRLHLAPRKTAVLAPRGEFSKGAINLKASRKRAFLAATRMMGLHRNLVWQASTEFEAEDIRRAMGDIASDIRIAVDLPRGAGSPVARTPRKAGEALRVVFLSRISPKKNLLFALEVLARVRVPVIFTIVGPSEDTAYWARCMAQIERLPSNIEVIWAGSLQPENVIAELAGHDLFFLPTLGENYGHVIAEALEAGLRLLISDQTPWRNLAAEGVGHDLPLSEPDRFASVIEAEATRTDHERSTADIAAYLTKKLQLKETIAANRALFQRAIEQMPNE